MRRSHTRPRDPPPASRRQTGDIVEGAEDDIRAFYYAVAFQREYVEADEDGGEPLLAWKVVDFHVQGGDAYY